MSLESFNSQEGEQERSIEQKPEQYLSQEELDEKYRVHRVEESPEEKAADDKKLAEIDEALNLLKPSKGTTVATNAADFVPVVGSGKMILESFKGSQYGTGKEIKGLGRAVHGVAGAVFLAADLTGVGAAASLGGKVLVRGGMKVAEKGAEKLAVGSAEKVAAKVAEREAQKQLLKKEGGRLYERGRERRIRQDELASESYEGGSEKEQKMV